MREDTRALRASLRKGAFVRSNGEVLRIINILRTDYVRLADVQGVLEDKGVELDEFCDSVNYLSLEGYIQLRRVEGHGMVPDIADVDWKQLEGKVSAKGIKLLAGSIRDDLVEV